MFKSISAEKGVARSLRAARFYEDESSGGEEPVLGLRLGGGPFFDR